MVCLVLPIRAKAKEKEDRRGLSKEGKRSNGEAVEAAEVVETVEAVETIGGG